MSLPLSYSLTNENVKQKIKHLINEINQFNDIEKLLLYIQLPSGSPANDPLKHKGPGNPFGKKADVEVAQTYTWIQSHLEEDSTVSLPKHEVYDEYRCFCQANSFEPLCVADFGKAMKHVFPRVKPRRLGQRGNSKYCYSGLRKRLTLPVPCLPDLSNTSTSLNNVVNDNENNNAKVNGDDIRISKSNSVEEDSSSDPSSTGEALGVDKCARKNDNNFTTNNSNSIDNVDGKHLVSSDIVHNAATRLILDWAEGILEQNFSDLQELGKYLINYDLVDKTSVAAITLMSSSTTFSPGKSELFSSLSSEDVKTNSFNSNFNNKTLLNPIKSKREATQSNVQKKSNIKEIPGNTRRKGVDRTSKSVSSNCINNNSKSTNNANGNDDSGFVIATSSSSSFANKSQQEAASTVTLTRVNRRSRRLSVNGNGRSMDISGGVGGCALGVNGDNLKSTSGLQSMQVCVKKEAIQNGSNIDTSSANNINNNNTNNGSKTSSPLLKATISQNKIPIPRSGASHHIIVLPNNVQLTTTATRSISQIFTGDKSGSQSVPVTCLSSSSSSSSSLSSSFVFTSSSSSSTSSTSSLSSSCSTIKSTSSLTSPPSLSTATLKYKRIQPKPVSLSRSNSNVLESTFNYSTINEHTTSSSTSTLSSSSNNNNVINSSQGRNINNLANAVNIVNCNNEINTLKSNENETLVVTRRHSLATVPLNGAELVLTSTDRNIGLLNRKDIVVGLGNRGGSGGGSGSGAGGPGSSSGLKEERCLDKTQIKRHCDGSRDSDNNISCKKRYTSAEGCEAVSPLSLSTTSATLFVTSTQPVTSTINGTGSGAGAGAGAGAGGIILTLANGRSSAETNSSSPSLPSPLPIIGINTLTSDDVLFDGLPDNGLVDDDNDNRQPHQNQAEQPQQLEVNHNHNNIKASTSEMCIKLQELECDALNDDLNEAQQPQPQQQQHGASTSSSLMDSYEDCNPSTLSQLRRLLEKNLPNSKSNSNTIGLSIPVTTIPSDPITVAAVAINATNVINNHNNHNHHHQLNLVEQVHRSNEPSNAINGINIINNNHHNHQEMMESTQHHLSYTSNQEATSNVDNNNCKSVGSKAKKYLHPPSGKDDILSSNGSFTAESLVSSAPKKSIDSDCCNSPMLISNFSESDALLVSNGSVIDGAGGNAGGDMVSSMDYCNIQTQIPSVPASPNTRRQAFNFQPISLRITPTIPENSAIGSYVNGTNSSPPSTSTSSTTTTASLNILVGGGGNGNGNGICNMNGSNNAQQQHSPPTFSSNQRSIGVGLSQPPSSANSPFVSPRGTPIPLSRSRHDSGQSGYSGSRATPYPVLLDSGLSSISSSPFISPQSTPVPLSGRMRALGNCYSHHHSLHSRSSLINRARHSSGPGNPYTTMPASIGGTFSMRSSSVSPMVVSCNGNDLLLSSSNGYNNSNSNINHSGATLASINAAFGETKRTRNQSSTTTTTTTTSGVSSIGTPVSPKSEPLSPSSIFISGDMSASDLTSIGIASSSSNGGDSFMDSCFTSRDWLTNNSRFLLSGYHGSSDLSSSGVHGLLHGGSNVGPVLRQRHFSSPYATIANNASNNFSLVDPHSKEVQTLFKGSSFIESLLSSSNANNNANANTNDSDNNTVNDLGENSNGSSLTGNLSGDHPHSGSRPVLNRCHSVPIQHLGKLYNGSSFSPLEHGSFTPSSSLYSPADLNSPDRDFSAVSKSYPPTPLCNPNFSFPPTSPSNINTNSGSSSSSNSNNNNNSTITNPLISNSSGNNSTLSPSSGSTRLKLVEEETSLGSLAVDSVASAGSSSSNPTSNFLESGQDVMVSGLQSKDWTVGEAVIGADDIELAVSHPGRFHHREHQRNQHPHHHNHDPDLSPETGLLNTFEVRRTIDDTISGPIPMSDDLETTLEDLRDCDNDFSKFALELELEANGTSKFDDI